MSTATTAAGVDFYVNLNFGQNVFGYIFTIEFFGSATPFASPPPQPFIIFRLFISPPPPC
jgi:hypothetical protein